MSSIEIARRLKKLVAEHKEFKTVLDEHPEVKVLLDRVDRLKGNIIINGEDPIAHVYAEGLVEYHLQKETEPAANEACERLEKMGLCKHAARACVGKILFELLEQSYLQNREFDEENYRRKLALLGTEPKKLKKNKPCPCGSGLKLKHCCGKNMELLEADRFAGILYLGRGNYFLSPPFLIFDNPLHPIIQMENRVHIAFFLEKNNDIEGASRALEENIVLAEKFEEGKWLRNALQDMQILCMSHRSLKEKGLQVTERLIALAKNDDEKITYWCDKADLMCDLGKTEEAENEYQKIFSAYPYLHWSRFRYALYLKNTRRLKEARSALQELLRKREELDIETYRCALDLLNDLESERE